MQLIKGKEIADDILNNIKSKIENLEAKPTLAVILIGEDEASKIYVGLKEKAAREIGFNFLLYKYNADVEEEVVLSKVNEINEDKNIDGLIVQLPLPENLDKYKIINAISPKKDVDGFCQYNQDIFLSDQECHWPVFPKAIIKMVEFASGKLGIKNETPSVAEYSNISPFEYKGGEEKAVHKLTHTKAVIVCKSDDFGIIMRRAFGRIGIEAKYVFCDDLNSFLVETKNADIVVTACGKLNLINSEMVKNDAIIIDGGIVKEDGKVFGDVDLESFEKTDCFISPVPGGVGPVTVACLLENTFQTWSQERIKN